MRRTAFALIMVVSVALAIGASACDETVNLGPGYGAIEGKVLFPDGSPAYPAYVALDRHGTSDTSAASMTLLWTYKVDKSGSYSIGPYVVGEYDLYVRLGNPSTISGERDTVVTVYDQTFTKVPTLYIERHIEINYPKDSTYTTRQPKLSWASVPNASYYEVQLKRDSVEYEKTVKTTQTTIVWPESLNDGVYDMSVVAYDSSDIRQGTGWWLIVIKYSKTY